MNISAVFTSNTYCVRPCSSLEQFVQALDYDWTSMSYRYTQPHKPEHRHCPYPFFHISGSNGMTVQVLCRVNFNNSRPRSIVSGIVCASKWKLFPTMPLLVKTRFRWDPNYKPGGATFGAGTKMPIGARLVTYL